MPAEHERYCCIRPAFQQGGQVDTQIGVGGVLKTLARSHRVRRGRVSQANVAASNANTLVFLRKYRGGEPGRSPDMLLRSLECFSLHHPVWLPTMTR